MSIQAAFSWKFPQEGIYDPTMFKLKILSFLFGATGLEELKGPSQIWDYTDLTFKRVGNLPQSEIKYASNTSWNQL